ncbi:MAG: isochorismatase family protein [Verrucomicrobia bacterium]|nr:isochorismatase family protein [Verrucomicrobiota bacterium]
MAKNRMTSRRMFLKHSMIAGTGVTLGTRSAAGKTASPVNPSKENRILKLPARYYQNARIYGPGMPPSGVEGLHERIFERPVSQVGLVLVHLWNVGETDGPYPMDPNAWFPGEATNWVPKSKQIIAKKIKPALEAAREAGMEIFHLAQSGYANRYPQYRKIAADPELRSPYENVKVPGTAWNGTDSGGCVRPRSVEELWFDEFGPNFPGAVWQTHPKNFDIAKSVRPLPEENVFLTEWQLNGLCRRKDIDLLIYAGFMADGCVHNIPGAIRDMYKLKYRCILLRECTTAYEFEDTHERNEMTRAAIRLVETKWGYTAATDDFLRACRGAVSG